MLPKIFNNCHTAIMSSCDNDLHTIAVISYENQKWEIEQGRVMGEFMVFSPKGTLLTCNEFVELKV